MLSTQIGSGGQHPDVRAYISSNNVYISTVRTHCEHQMHIHAFPRREMYAIKALLLTSRNDENNCKPLDRTQNISLNLFQCYAQTCNRKYSCRLLIKHAFIIVSYVVILPTL